MSEEEIMHIIRSGLTIEATEGDVYNGGMGDGDMYTKVITIKLMLDGEVISECTV